MLRQAIKRVKDSSHKIDIVVLPAVADKHLELSGLFEFLRKKYSSADFWKVIGTDRLKRAEDFVREKFYGKVLVFNRADADAERLKIVMREHPGFFVSVGDSGNISSTRIKERLRSTERLDYIDRRVGRIIRSKKLYVRK